MDWQADDGLRWSMSGGFFLGPGCYGRSCRARGILGGDRARKDIAYWGVTEVLVGPADDFDQLRAAMTRILGRPGEHVADCWLWKIG